MYSSIVFLPLLGAIIAGFFGRWIGARGAQLVTCTFLLISCILSWTVFFEVALGGHKEVVTLLKWIDSGSFELNWALQIDTLTAVMLVVVTSVSALVHIYSVGYMSHDPHRPRFMAYLSLFTFSMLMLVTADNFVQLFFGWEAVGLASYLLIGFWFKKPSANAAAIKAFVVNRVGDFGFGLGIFAIYMLFGSVEFDVVFAMAPEMVGKTFTFLGMELDILTTVCLLLFVGAMGKSAQLFLHTWLPDAMEGPTPVSALIHAATMVTAGVFMVARCSPLFEYSPGALEVVTIVGASTAFFAATIGLVQNDIKRVIAYSTCSQLGYMFFALGIGAYEAAVFHLFTHAFFKALLFLGSGSVIHAMSDEQDMRNMGGIYKMIPFTWVMMLIGTLALTGFPFLAGYYSKDAIIYAAFASGSGVGMFAFVLAVTAAVLTAFYSWRLIFLTFHGAPRASEDVMKHVHESPAVMTVPLVILAVGAVFAGMVFKGYFVGDGHEAFWNGAIFTKPENTILEAATQIPAWVAWSPMFAMALGTLTSWYMYIRRPDLPVAMAKTHEPLYLFLLNKWYFDELYHWIFIKPSMWIGRFLWKQGDGRVIDGFGPNGIAATVLAATRKIVALQTGYVYHYAFAMMIGVAALVTWFMFTGAPH